MNSRTVTLRFGGPLTPVVRMLMIATAIIFVLQILVSRLAGPGWFITLFGLSHETLFREGMVWQLFTYLFLHDGFFHLFFNLLSLWMFGGELEEKWGSAAFLKYYLASGIGAGLCIAAMNYYTYNQYGNVFTIGSSGAIYGVFLAYAMLWPHRTVYLYFLFPVKIRTLLLIFGSIEFLGTISSATGTGGGVSHIGHLGGILAGFILMRTYPVYGYASSKKPAGPSGGLISRIKKKIRLRSTSERIQTRIKAKQIIDETLAKIAREGMNSLTTEERKRLEWARKNYFPGKDHTIH